MIFGSGETQITSQRKFSREETKKNAVNPDVWRRADIKLQGCYVTKVVVRPNQTRWTGKEKRAHRENGVTLKGLRDAGKHRSMPYHGFPQPEELGDPRMTTNKDRKSRMKS